MTTACQSCGGWFDRPAGETWRTLCKRCYVAKLRREGRFDPYYRRGSRPASPATEFDRERALLEGMNRAVGAVERALPAEVLRQCIALCHPDRHPPERAEAANVATRCLLALREMLRNRTKTTP